MHASCTLFLEDHSSFEEKNVRSNIGIFGQKIVFELSYRFTTHRLQQRKSALLASGGSFSYQVGALRRL